MDYFSLCLEVLCLAGQGVMHIAFAGRLTGKKLKPRHFAVYLLLLCLIEAASFRSGVSGTATVIVEALALYGASRFLLENRRSPSWIAAILAVYISQLSFGLVNSVEAVLFPHLVGSRWLYPLVLLAALAAFAICGGCYAAVLKCLSLTEARETSYAAVLVLPGLFFFAAELYILQTAYTLLYVPSPPENAGKHGVLLLLQLVGLGALFCTLYACRYLDRESQAQAALRSLTQAAQAQKAYIAEARTRYERTRAFRHDIRNHLAVLNGLLSGGRIEEGKAYLQKLDAASAALSFPCQTGSPVVDILLGEKLGLAQASGILAEVSLVLPRPCSVDELDLCVIFANALDNAVHACQAVEGGRSIRIRGERQGDFYMLAFENTCADGPLPPAGTGLSNIKAVAEKYHGAMLAEKSGRSFFLTVLPNIS